MALDRIAWWIATTGGLGLAPHWPGTVGAAAGAALAAVLLWLAPETLLASAAVLGGMGVWAAKIVEAHEGTDDPQLIVIDETFGALLALALVPPTLLSWIVAFLAFRLFDIAKPWPISGFHHQRGGWAIMLDDGAAALLAAALVWLIALSPEFVS